MSGILDTIGDTPLINLRNIYKNDRGIKLYAKAEYMNPSGSVKDRAAKAMVLSAIKTGELTKDKTIIEATSGSTGIAIAMIGAALGYKVMLCLPSNVSKERKQAILAYGATIIESNPLEGVDGAVRRVREMVSLQPALYYYPDQYNNELNQLTHYHKTSSEIWKQTSGKVTHFIAGTGTSGTLIGTARGLKERNPEIKAVMMQPDEPFHGLEGIKHLESTELPGIYDDRWIDGKEYVRTEDAYKMVKELTRKEGIFVGISAAANVTAAIRVAERAPDNSVIVTILCDAGHRYLSEPVWDELEYENLWVWDEGTAI